MSRARRRPPRRGRRRDHPIPTPSRRQQDRGSRRLLPARPQSRPPARTWRRHSCASCGRNSVSSLLEVRALAALERVPTTMTVYDTTITGVPRPAAELAAMRWITRREPTPTLAPALRDNVPPHLRSRDLLDRHTTRQESAVPPECRCGRVSISGSPTLPPPASCPLPGRGPTLPAAGANPVPSPKADASSDASSDSSSESLPPGTGRRAHRPRARPDAPPAEGRRAHPKRGARSESRSTPVPAARPPPRTARRQPAPSPTRHRVEGRAPGTRASRHGPSGVGRPGRGH